MSHWFDKEISVGVATVSLTKKEIRKIYQNTDSLFNAKAMIFPGSLSEIPTNNTLLREIHIGENQLAYFTDSGFASFNEVASLIHRGDYFNGQADYSDIWGAWKKVFEQWMSNHVQPENGNEVLEAISARVTPAIGARKFVVPLFGVSLAKVESFAVGAMTIVRDPISLLEASSVSHSPSHTQEIVKMYRGGLWLCGSAVGTDKVARRVFSEEAALTVGLIAIAAAANYEYGATGFRIGIGMTPEDAPGRSAWMTWSEAERSLSTHHTLPRGQLFEVDIELSPTSDGVQTVLRAFSTITKPERSELEEAIRRAVFWYSDAHRDSLLVMRFIKYWSCVETFFSVEKTDITRSVSSGLANVLAYGGFRFLDVSEYINTKRKIASLYDARSKAIHRGLHLHVTEEDVSQFSQWISWLIMELVNISEHDCRTLSELKVKVDQIDAIGRQTQKNKASFRITIRNIFAFVCRITRCTVKR